MNNGLRQKNAHFRQLFASIGERASARDFGCNALIYKQVACFSWRRFWLDLRRLPKSPYVERPGMYMAIARHANGAAHQVACHGAVGKRIRSAINSSDWIR